MALIACPECEQQVSDRARACPHCGFPVASEIERALAEVTGVGRSRSARQKAAAEKLQNWAKGYAQSDAEDGERRDDTKVESFLDRHRRAIIIAVVTIVVVLQLIMISAVYR